MDQKNNFEDLLDSDSTFYQERVDFVQALVAENPDYLARLPRAEQEVYFYIVQKRMNQKDLVPLIGITQGGISHKFSRLFQRLKFLHDIEQFDLKNFEKKLSSFEPLEIELLKGMLETTCQSETARRLNSLFKTKMNQVKVRYRFENCLLKMKQTKHPYYELFLLIKKNLYILYDIRLPQFSR